MIKIETERLRTGLPPFRRGILIITDKELSRDDIRTLLDVDLKNVKIVKTKSPDRLLQEITSESTFKIIITNYDAYRKCLNDITRLSYTSCKYYVITL